MELPRLNFDDFYKFCMSAGIILFIVASIGITFISIFYPESSSKLITILIFYLAAFSGGIILIIWSGNKWYKNQRIHDNILEKNYELMGKSSVETLENKNEGNKSPQIDYRVDNGFQDTIKFSLLKDWKVWFMVRNYDNKKYKIYFTILFYINEKIFHVESKGYYGGKKAWNLNPNNRIVAPGLVIPEKIKEELSKKGTEFEIRIKCRIKDEKNKLIEERLPVRYVYNLDGDSWNFEP